MNTQTRYARYTSQGREDDYGGYRPPAWYGHCDSCKISLLSLGSVEGPLHAADWANRHNQAHHEAQSRPALQTVSAGLRVQVTPICQHPLPAIMRRPGELCNRPLTTYKGGWHYDQPLLACDIGHLSLALPEDSERQRILSAALQLDSGYATVERRKQLDAQIRSLTAQRQALS